jgi:hypothetical protein
MVLLLGSGIRNWTLSLISAIVNVVATGIGIGFSVDCGSSLVLAWGSGVVISVDLTSIPLSIVVAFFVVVVGFRSVRRN